MQETVSHSSVKMSDEIPKQPHHGHPTRLLNKERANIQLQVMVELGFSKHLVSNLLHKHGPYDSAGDLFLACDEVNENEFASTEAQASSDIEESVVTPSATKQDLRLETYRLIMSTKCCLCKDNVRSIVCLPCSHLSVCEPCSNVKKCPQCGETILHRIKTFY